MFEQLRTYWIGHTKAEMFGPIPGKLAYNVGVQVPELREHWPAWMLDKEERWILADLQRRVNFHLARRDIDPFDCLQHYWADAQHWIEQCAQDTVGAYDDWRMRSWVQQLLVPRVRMVGLRDGVAPLRDVYVDGALFERYCDERPEYFNLSVEEEF